MANVEHVSLRLSEGEQRRLDEVIRRAMERSRGHASVTAIIKELIVGSGLPKESSSKVVPGGVDRPMAIPPEDQKFENALKIFETQVGEATQFWFAASAMNEIAISNPDTLTALNVTPSFWLTARVSMENQAILAVGKIFGPRKTNPHNIDSLFDVLRGSVSTVFSRESLAARKRRMSSNADEWLPQFMQRVHVPDLQDINELHALSQPHRRTYETQWEQIRNEHVAHTGLVDPTARWEAFQKTRISDLEELMGFLNQFHDALWRMYYDGRRPVVEPVSECSVKALVARRLEELSRSRNQEHIVAETRKCLALFTEAAVPQGR